MIIFKHFNPIKMIWLAVVPIDEQFIELIALFLQSQFILRQFGATLKFCLCKFRL
jgi:hypothetical protein